MLYLWTHPPKDLYMFDGSVLCKVGTETEMVEVQKIRPVAEVDPDDGAS